MNDQLKTAKMLAQLCLLFNQSRTEEQLAAYASYLTKHFTFQQLTFASEKILQRNTFFPQISDFFNILDPVVSSDKDALMKYEELKLKIKEVGYHYPSVKDNLTDYEQRFISIVGFNNVLTIHPKEARDLMEIVISKIPELRRVE